MAVWPGNDGSDCISIMSYVRFVYCVYAVKSMDCWAVLVMCVQEHCPVYREGEVGMLGM